MVEETELDVHVQVLVLGRGSNDLRDWASLPEGDLIHHQVEVGDAVGARLDRHERVGREGRTGGERAGEVGESEGGATAGTRG